MTRLEELEGAWDPIDWWDLLICGDCLTKLKFQAPAGRGMAEYACPDCGGVGHYPAKGGRSERWRSVRRQALQQIL